MQSAQVCKRGVYVCDRVVRESVVGESACVCVCVEMSCNHIQSHTFAILEGKMMIHID